MKKAAEDYIMSLLLDMEEYLYNRYEEGSIEEKDLINRISFIKEYLDKKDVQYVLKAGEIFCHCQSMPSSNCCRSHEC